MLRTARSLPPKGLLTLRFDPGRFPPKPAACYRASWQLPGPDLPRQATTSFSLNQLPISTSNTWAHLLGEIHARSPQDLVGLTQLAHLALQALQPLALLRGQAIAARAMVGLALAHPLTQRLAVDAEILGDMRDRAAALGDEPHRALAQLVRVLLRGRHRRSPSSPQDKILAWRTPSNPAWLSVLDSPVYAGAYAFGKTRRERYVDEHGNTRQRLRRLRQAEWGVLIWDHHRGYIDKAAYERNRERI